MTTRDLSCAEYSLLDALTIVRDKQRVVETARDYDTWRLLERIADRYRAEFARIWKQRWQADDTDLRPAFHAVRRVG